MKTEIYLNLTDDQLNILKGFLVFKINQLNEEKSNIETILNQIVDSSKLA